MFSATSRYANVAQAKYTDRQGREIPYKLLRQIPDTAPTQELHLVRQGERLDLIAWACYGDPEQFWRICDVNRGFFPADLLAQPGEVLTIPIPGP